MESQLSGLPLRLSYSQFASVPEAGALWQQRDHLLEKSRSCFCCCHHLGNDQIVIRFLDRTLVVY
jgi:hypothetical protein